MASIASSSSRLVRGVASSSSSSFSPSHLVASSSSTNSRKHDSASRTRHLSTRTAQHPTQDLQLTLALIKPSVCAYQPDVSAILKEIKQSGLNVARSRRVFWTSADAHAFYAEHRGRFYYDRLILGMISGPALALALYGPHAITHWRALLGPTKAYMGKYSHPHSLRARYGLGDTRNGFHGSDSPESAQRELALVFDGWDTQWWLQREQGRLPADQDGRLNPLGF
ncbi:related to Nucleoside diphosphate kinase 6 [Sporisorium reilianum SRZ2]|uniref:Nucleoside diphosphate kinase n=1 Tax=Sporisorium reilianum (strain SRZ2) TaxID=999809 RepID=E6ZN00_SPORE|nr:related to Nucleoside diphosphate kinase 6 [Sporisorium reilianum SRZ2]